MIKNLCIINPIKREKIKKGLEYVDKKNKIKHLIDKVIIFGSSVRDDCREDSDIDICIVSNASSADLFEIHGNLPHIMNDLCDIIRYNKLDEKMKKEINQKGVVVYEY